MLSNSDGMYQSVPQNHFCRFEKRRMEWKKLMLETLMEQQREYFASGATLPVKVRMEALSRLEKALQKQEQILCKALHTDLGKSKTESVMCEIGLVQGEIRWMKQHLGRLCRTNMSEHRWRSSLQKVIKALLLMAMC